MKTIAKVLESMLSKPATPTWNTAGPGPASSVQVGPTQIGAGARDGGSRTVGA